MEHEHSQKRFESVYSTKVRAGKRRTYFFDVRRTKGDDYYITLTESTRRFNGDGYERHKIFLYKEDFNRFLQSLEDAVNHVKTELMPDYDYDEFTKRQQEWEARRAEEESNTQQEKEKEKVTAPVAEDTAPAMDEDDSEDHEDDDSGDSGDAGDGDEIEGDDDGVTEEAANEQSGDLEEDEDMSW
ncbi:MAG: DUF3276 family protein [Saprospiraceae bacterium]|nr:DUF3276 family protein [Saprospiraceae bacterium]